MSRPIRDRDPKAYRLITIRTDEARLWMIPTRKMEKLLGGIVARYAFFMRIEIYAYCFLTNHYHLLIRAPLGNTDEFCENVNREIARRVNWTHHRIGNFWQRRYDDLIILSDNDLLEAFLYITTNPVKHGLVEHPRLWPGLCSYQQSLSERERTFTFYYYSALNPADTACKHDLKLSILPQFTSMSSRQRRQRIESLIEERTTKIVEFRRSKGRGFLGIRGVMSTTPGEIPQSISRSSRPPAYSKDAALLLEARIMRRERRERYREASMRYRLGDFLAQFPEYSFRPPLHRLPRIKPFTVIEGAVQAESKNRN
jgi:REP element-mobilizing transposase RayT